MAGHSKWANIKHRKAAQDAKKGQAFTKFSREIMMAAKEGGSDPTANFRLRTAIEKAKSAGLPSNNIQRAIDKGCGNSSGDNLDDVIYEGYGPGGVAIFIETMTDNRNRTAGDIRSYFNKYSGNLGSDGCVAWMFEKKGIIIINAKGLDEETVLEASINAGAEGFELNREDNTYEVTTETETMNSVCQTLTNAGLIVQSAETTRIPQNSVEIKDLTHATDLLKLLDHIENHDDVQAVHSNFDINDSLLEQVAPE